MRITKNFDAYQPPSILIVKYFPAKIISYIIDI